MSIFMVICLAFLGIIICSLLSLGFYAIYVYAKYGSQEAKQRLGNFADNVGLFIKNCFITLGETIEDISLSEMFHDDDDDDPWD